MDNDINQLLLVALFCIVALLIVDWAMRPKDRDRDD
jgi:hypothetical protein